MKYPIKPEQLRHIITIQKPKTDQDGKPLQDDYGDPTSEMEPIAADIHAFVEPTGGSEFYAAQRINAEADHNVWIRYRTGIDYGMKVSYGNRILEIVAPPIDLYEAHRWIRLICKELL